MWQDGKIDILVNDAAINYYADIFEDTLDVWRKAQALNLEAIYWGSKLIAPHVPRQHWGRIISIRSIQAIATEGWVGAYAGSSAIIRFTKS